MSPPQIIKCPDSVALSLKRTRSRENGSNNRPVWHAVRAETETARAKDTDRSDKLSDEALAGIIAEIILAVLNVNRIKMAQDLRRI